MTTDQPRQEALFAMGCFWCSEAAFADHKTHAKLPGIVSLTVGYSGGTSQNPTYEDHEGHFETLRIIFDPTEISYKQLLNIFWRNIDPFDEQGQFCDKGSAYRSALFYVDEDQRRQSETSKEKLEKAFNKKVSTLIQPAGLFYKAEDYHQEHKIKNPFRYSLYRCHSGRDDRLKEIWEHSDL